MAGNGSKDKPYRDWNEKLAVPFDKTGEPDKIGPLFPLSGPDGLVELNVARKPATTEKLLRQR